jgi:acyl carrier protein
MKTMSKKLYKIISNTLSIPLSEINESSGPENTEGWNSFKGLLLLDELEKEFNIKFTIDEIYDVKIVSDIKNILEKHSINLED